MVVLCFVERDLSTEVVRMDVWEGWLWDWTQSGLRRLSLWWGKEAE